jgi:lipopolysaccharide export system permease LptF/LptG-like protein
MKSPGRRVLRLASRLLPPSIVASLIAPTVADMQWEFEAACRQCRGRTRYAALVRGYAALLRLVPVLVVRTVGVVTDAWMQEDDRAMQRVVSYSATAVLSCTVLLMLPPSGPLQRMTPALMPTTVLLLVPQALALALPVGFLIGSLIGLRARPRTGRTLRRLLVGSGAVVLLTLATLWVMPTANQAFRQRLRADLVARGVVPDHIRLEKGPNERSLRELHERIDQTNLIPEDAAALQPLEYAFHVRFAITASPLCFAIMAFGVVAVGRERWSAVLAGIAVAVAVVLLIWGNEARVVSSWSPVLRAYLPNVVFGVLGVVLSWCSLRRGDRRTALL